MPGVPRGPGGAGAGWEAGRPPRQVHWTCSLFSTSTSAPREFPSDQFLDVPIPARRAAPGAQHAHEMAVQIAGELLALARRLSVGFGPLGSDSLLLSDSHSVPVLTQDSTAVVEALAPLHPLAAMVLNAAKGEAEACGSGLASIVIMTAHAYNACGDLQGSRATLIRDAAAYIRWLEVAAFPQLRSAHGRDIGVSEQDQRHSLSCVVSSTLCGGFSPRVEAILVRAVVDWAVAAAERCGGLRCGLHVLRMRAATLALATGGLDAVSTRVVTEGVWLTQGAQLDRFIPDGVAEKISSFVLVTDPAGILSPAGCNGASVTDSALLVTRDAPSLLEAIAHTQDRAVQLACSLSATGIGLVICVGCASDAAAAALLSRGILCASRIEPEDADILRDAFAVESIADANDLWAPALLENYVGRLRGVERRRLDGRMSLLLRNESPGGSGAPQLLLAAPAKAVAQRWKLAVIKAVAALSQVAADPTVLPGGGAAELALLRFGDTAFFAGEKTRCRLRHAVEKMLEAVPDALLRTCVSRSAAARTRSELAAECGCAALGVSFGAPRQVPAAWKEGAASRRGCVASPMADGVVTPLLSFERRVRAAAHMLHQLLRVDAVLRVRRSEGREADA